MAIDYVQIGRNVKHYRLQKELKQIQLAEKVHVTEQHISHIECGRTILSLPLLVSLSEALSVDVRLLLGMKDRTPELDAELSELFSSCTPEEKRFCIEICKTALSFRP